MPIEIKMPALSPTMEEGNLAKWHVKEGDAVEPGDVIAEIETDKATMEVESADEGTIGKIAVSEGTEGVKVGEVIAVLLEEGEDKAALKDTGKKEEKPAEKKPEKAEKKEEKEAEEKEAPESPSPSMGEGGGEGDKKPSPSPQSSPTRGEEEGRSSRIKASPLAKRLAKEAGIDLAAIKGSGPRGRIIKRDIEGAEKGGESRAPAAVSTEGDAPFEEVKLSNMRKIIAKRLLESKQTIPHYYLTIEADITELLGIRKGINENVEGAKVSVNDFIIKAVALGLKKVPNANVQWGGDVMRKYQRADISVAVAIPDGLITPIIKGAESKALRDISVEMKQLAEKARAGKLTPEEYQGGTFSISNLGMYGITEFAAVINPPQAGILAIGAGAPRAVLKDGKVENRTVMAMTGSFDHRAVDGATGAEFMKAVKELLEAPAVLLY